jgi:hypothetical protein
MDCFLICSSMFRFLYFALRICWGNLYKEKKNDESGRPIQMYIKGQCFYDKKNLDRRKIDRRKNTKNTVPIIIRFCFPSSFSFFSLAIA